MICPHCLKEIRQEKIEISRLKRFELILNSITEKAFSETIYRKVRKRGYPLSRKTFSRDIKILAKGGFEAIKTKQKPFGGRSTEIIKMRSGLS